MTSSLLAFAAALFSATLAFAAIVRKRHSLPSWCFFAGMIALALESTFGGMSLSASQPARLLHWQIMALLAASVLPAAWLCFSVTYSRGNRREFLAKWRLILLAACLLPVGLATGFWNELLRLESSVQGDGGRLIFGLPGTGLNVLLLIATVLTLMNLETTFRSAVGTMRWRIKFLVLGLAVIFGARIYTVSQALLFSGPSLAMTGVQTAALLIGCAFIAIAYLRTGFAEIDVYPSPAVLHSSVTVLLAGGYLFVVGVLAQTIARLGGPGNFQTQAFIVLLGSSTLAVLLLSDRLRQRVQQFLSRHFKTARHDFRKIWTVFTQRISSVLDPGSLSTESAKLISEIFNVLSVTIWLVDEKKERLICSASTSHRRGADRESTESLTAPPSMLKELRELGYPFDLEKPKAEWANALRQLNPTEFSNGGSRACIPLVAGERVLGVAILADRVNGVPYTVEELDLLKCIGDQIAAGLLNLRLTDELMLAKELEAFQTLSAFFVHDLKNTASSLGLMLQNLPVHFDDPAFREDALRGIANTVDRINLLISRLSALRHTLEPKPSEFDLNQLVKDALTGLERRAEVQLVQELQPLPAVLADREQLQTVLINLLFNARDAVGERGIIRVETSRRDGSAVLSITDNGCGMTPAFLKDSLFRPFRTTKKKGLGIGMFQAKMIVEANRGNIQVESEPGKSTTFRVILPLKAQA